jgi:hypothetical protein
MLNSSCARALVVIFWLWCLAQHRVIMLASVVGSVILPEVQSAEVRYRVEEVGPVISPAA